MRIGIFIACILLSMSVNADPVIVNKSKTVAAYTYALACAELKYNDGFHNTARFFVEEADRNREDAILFAKEDITLSTRAIDRVEGMSKEELRGRCDNALKALLRLRNVL